MNDTAAETLPVIEEPTSRLGDAGSRQILVAEDHPISLHLLERQLGAWGFEVITATNGEEALRILESEAAPPLAIIDWTMPKIDGASVCARVRERADLPYTYLLLLTARNKTVDLTMGLDLGADDFVSKPYDPDELLARVRVGQRVAALERALQSKVAHLEDALSQVKTLKGLLPICMYCKSIRDEQSYWRQVEEYIHSEVGTDFSHGICPNCVGEFFRTEP
jgi:CheY-like chemotaxis protein